MNSKFLNLRNKNLKSLEGIGFPEDLEILDLSNNQITNLNEVKFPKSLYLLEFVDNKIESLGSVENIKSLFSNLESLNLSDNQLKNEEELITLMKVCKNLGFLRFERNPISYKFYNLKDLSFKKFKGNSISLGEIAPSFYTLKKGTVLFRNMYDIKEMISMYAGGLNEKTGIYYCHPTHQTYFMPHPFFQGYGSTTLISVLTQDVNILLGVKPSLLTKYRDFKLDYITENCKEDALMDYNSNYGCPPSILLKNDIQGWIGMDARGKYGNIWHAENHNFYDYRNYVSFYEDNNGVIDRPEIMIHSLNYKRLKPKKTVATPASEIEGREVDWIKENQHRFNFKTLFVIEDNTDYKSYKKLIDELLSPEGYTDTSGTYHMSRNNGPNEDGMYYIKSKI